jgi:hypothetical protein
MKKTPLVIALLAAAILAGAPSHQAVAAGVKADKEVLMRAVFGARYLKDGQTLAELPTPEDKSKLRRYALAPLASELLASGETVLVAQATWADERDEGEAVLAGPLINVFVLRETGGKWTVVRRHHNIVYRGYGPRPGSVLFTALGPQRQALAIASLDLDEGCHAGALHLYDLADNRLRDLANIANEMVDTPDCNGIGMKKAVSVTSTWHLAPQKKAGQIYDDLVMVFKTEKFGVAATKVTARYAYDGKAFKLVAGENPLHTPSP